MRTAHVQPAALLGLLTAAGLAWWITAERMAGMDAGPGTDLGTLGWFTGVWVVMMAAMMLPSLAPTAARYARLPDRGGIGPSLLFAAGYLVVWSAAGLVAYGLFVLGQSLLAGELAWESGGRWLDAGVVAMAAIYQLSPLKSAYLARCRTVPDQPCAGAGSFELGVRNGGWCLGCSWALMAALFALGVMSLTWMAVIAVVVAFEKVSPRPRLARLGAALLLALLVIGILFAPHDVPGFVVPGSPGAAHAMTAMG